MSKVREWLATQGLTALAEVFDREQIDWDALWLLSAEDLRDLGLPIGLRAKLSAALRALRGSPAPRDALAAGPDSGLSEADPPLLAGGERRQITALFSDIVGYTELANRHDPEVLQRMVRLYEEACAVCIARYEGYVFQLLGDSVVAFFGYPLAHEGEAERAIHAGLQIIQALTQLEIPEVGRLAVRIGIATGVVVVTDKGAVGETMNLAARLQGIAQPGSVVVSERVQRLAGGSFIYRDLGEQQLKGIVSPVRAHEIAGVGAAASRFEAATGKGLTPLIGREQEIGLLLERWAQAQDGEGRVVLLSGEPGIGKSRILNALRGRVKAQQAQTLWMQCSPYYMNSAFWPASSQFERILKFTPDETPASKLAKLEAMIVTQFGRPRADVGHIATMMSIPCGDGYGTAAMTSEKRKQETLRTLVDLCEVAARSQPTLLLLEDLHWADPTTLEVADQLIERARTIPLLIVLTHRPEFRSRWAEQGHISAMNLSRLTQAQSAAVVSRLAGGKALPPAVLDQILNKTDGVPLYVEELTLSILESGQLSEQADRYVHSNSSNSSNSSSNSSKGEQDVTIPATLRDLLMARLDRYQAAKEVAQIGAAIGRTFRHALIAAVVPHSPAALAAGLAQLIDSGLATSRGQPPEASYTFKHALVQEVAYDSLLKSRRQKLHARIAQVIAERFANIEASEPEVLAHHLTAAGLPAAAIPLWQAAGDLALKRMALTEAIAHLNQGLRLLPGLPATVERDRSELGLRRALGTAWMAAQGWPTLEARASLLPALKLTGSAASGSDILPVHWGLFANTLSRGRVAESVHWAQELLALGESRGDSDILVTAQLMLTVSTFWLGDLLACQAHADAVSSLYDAVRHHYIADVINHDPLTGAGVYRAQVSWMLGYPDRAVAECDAKDAHAQARGHIFDRGFALCAGADVFEYRCEPQAQRERILACERLGRENGLTVLWQMMAPLRHGAALVRAGQARQGVALLREGLAMREAGGGHGGSNPYLNALLAEGLGRCGDIPAALRIIEAQVEQIERPGWGERSHFAEVRRIEGWLFELRGDLEAAETSYRLSLDWARTQHARSWELRTATSLASMLQAQGRAGEARDLLAPVCAWFSEGWDTHDLVRARQFLASLG